MALVKKEVTVQFRVPAELRDAFKEWCETARRRTVSEELRGYMEWNVDRAREGTSAADKAQQTKQSDAAVALKAVKLGKVKPKDPEMGRSIKAAMGGAKPSRQQRRQIERWAKNIDAEEK